MLLTSRGWPGPGATAAPGRPARTYEARRAPRSIHVVVGSGADAVRRQTAASRPASSATAHVQRATRTCRRSRSSRCFSRQSTSPNSRGPRPRRRGTSPCRRTRPRPRPSRSPRHRRGPRRPGSPAVSPREVEQEHLTRDRLSPGLMLSGSARVDARRPAPSSDPAGTASTSSLSSSAVQRPCLSAWSAAATAVERSGASEVGDRARRCGDDDVADLDPGIGTTHVRRTRGDARPRAALATRTRTASGHGSILGRPHTAAADDSAKTGRVRRGTGPSRGPAPRAGARGETAPLVVGDPDAVAHWCHPPRAGSTPRHAGRALDAGCPPNGVGRLPEHPDTVPESPTATGWSSTGTGIRPAPTPRAESGASPAQGGTPRVRPHGPDSAKCPDFTGRPAPGVRGMARALPSAAARAPRGTVRWMTDVRRSGQHREVLRLAVPAFLALVAEPCSSSRTPRSSAGWVSPRSPVSAWRARCC